MQVLVALALEAEFAVWRRQRRFRPVPADRRDSAVAMHEAEIDGATVRVALTGVGAARAQALRAVLERGRPDLCLAGGLAGALSPRQRRGTVIVAREVLGSAGDRRYASDGRLVAEAEACGARAIGLLASADRILVTAAEKRALASRADVVDMESFTILEAAAALGVPAGAVRAISDGADEDLPVDFNRTIGADGRMSLVRMAGQMARHPARLGRLVEFGRGSAAAAAALGGFLDRYVGRLAAAAREAEALAG